jgi:hypothetical protein
VSTLRLATIWTLVRRDLSRSRGALFTSGFGIAAGTAALVFFLALGLGVRSVLLGDVFPIDQVELEPPKAKDPGVLGLLLGGGGDAPGVTDDDLQKLAKVEGVRAVYPKLRLSFPTSGRGGKEIFGYDVGTSELVGDGIDPALVADELPTKLGDGGLLGPASVESLFTDPLERPGAACDDDAGCKEPQYCEKPSGKEHGRCSDPVPVIVSRYLVEVFDKSIAPAHNLPPIGETMVTRAKGVTFNVRLGESLLGRAKSGSPRTARARLVGISRRAIDLGVTFPLAVVKRWNEELGGGGHASGARMSSVIVKVDGGGAVAGVVARGGELGLTPKDTRARDVSVLVSGVMGLLALVAAVIFLVSASNIAYTFRVLAAERRAEIALYRAVGARSRDVLAWMLGLATTVGVLGGVVGLVVARSLALAADWAGARYLPDFPFKPSSFFAFPLWLVALGAAFAALFSVLGALGPARSASRTDPSIALASGVN